MRITACFFILFIAACSGGSDNNLQKENARLQRENDSIRALLQTVDTLEIRADTTADRKPRQPSPPGAGRHPVSLQWIGWDKPGEAILTPDTAGWYRISGRQFNKDGEYLDIKGLIRRLSARELEFEGTIETFVRTNNGGEPCVKRGRQQFYAKGTRTYWRLQNMENCAGGMLLDYVDIYPGNSGL